MVGLLFCCNMLYAQDSARVENISLSAFEKVSGKAAWLNRKMDKKTAQLLTRLQKYEAQLQQQMSGLDSSKTRELFAQSALQYQRFLQQLKNKQAGLLQPLQGEYLPLLDTLTTGLNFLNSLAKDGSKLGEVKNLLEPLKKLESNIGQAEDIKRFIQLRRQQITGMLGKYTRLPKGLGRKLDRVNKEIAGYTAMIRDYKEYFRNPDKLAAKALTVVNKLPAFKKFMSENSQLAGMLGLANGSRTTPTAVGGVTGLNTRQQLLGFMQNQVPAIDNGNIASMVQQSLNVATDGGYDPALKVKELLNKYKTVDIPGYKPVQNHTKTFLQKIEYGTNLQTTRGNTFFPVTTDLGLSLGYAISARNIVGIGASYKIGWGKDLRNIDISGQGVGVRSFIDVNIKESFFVSGGFEYNYQQPFKDFRDLPGVTAWQKSGLIGATKILGLKPASVNIFKKTKIQLLWDFLSYSQVPRSTPFKFRVGYNF